MRIISVIFFTAFLVAGCGSTPPQSAGTKVIYQEVIKEVPKPCPVKAPKRPGALARPLPADPGALVSLLTSKLLEWAGAGGYAERAEDAIATCTAPL